MTCLFSRMATKRILDVTPPHYSAKQLKRAMSPADIKSPDPSATVNALVTSLSPIKAKERTFFGELSDGGTVVPLVGFDKSQREKLEQFYHSQKPVTLNNCQISLNKAGKPQVIINSYTVLKEAPGTTFQTFNPNTLASPLLSVSNEDTLEEYDRVTVRVAVVKVNEAQHVSKDKVKQEVIVADDSASTTLSLWGEDIGKLKENKSYQLNRMQVHKFLGQTQLTYPRFGGSFHAVADLEEGCVRSVTEGSIEHMESVTVIGVGQLEGSFSCISCEKPILISQTTIQGQQVSECNTCGTKQKVRSVKTTAKLYLEDSSGTSLSLRAHQEALTQIVKSNDVTNDNLLHSEPFDVSFNNFNVITSVSRMKP